MWPKVPEGGRRFRKVAEGSGRWPKVPEGGRRFRNVAEGSGRWPKVPEGSRRFRKVAEGSGRWPKVPEGGRKIQKVAEGSGRWPKVPEGGRISYRLLHRRLRSVSNRKSGDDCKSSQDLPLFHPSGGEGPRERRRLGNVTRSAYKQKPHLVSKVSSPSFA